MKRTVYILTIMLLFTTFEIFSQTWEQVGQDIDGEISYGFLGYSVGVNYDGTIVVVGAKGETNAFTSEGAVRVYRNNNGTWEQVGHDIWGGGIEARFGSAVTINGDGTVIAVGAIYRRGNPEDNKVKVYKYNSSAGEWEILGDTLKGGDGSSWFGKSVSLNRDGNILAVGDSRANNYKGRVSVFELNNGVWELLGSNIDADGGQMGTSVALSPDGTVVAAGGIGGNGYVKVFRNFGEWDQLGKTITGDRSNDQFGISVSINSDFVLAVGAHYYDGADGNVSNCGLVKVFQFNGEIWPTESDRKGTLLKAVAAGSDYDEWEQLWDDIVGKEAEEMFGFSVSISDNNVVAVGAYKNSDVGQTAGVARIYEVKEVNDTDKWVQIGSDIPAKAYNDHFGYSVSINHDGKYVAIGAPDSEGNLNHDSAGQLRIFKRGEVPAVNITRQPQDVNDACGCEEVVFTIEGENITSYQWQVSNPPYYNSWSDLSDDDIYSGTTSDTLTVNVKYYMDSKKYKCRLSNGVEFTYSDDAKLSLENEAPVIISMPDNKIIYVDENCSAVMPDYTSEVTATDNCDSVVVSQWLSPNTGLTAREYETIITVADCAQNAIRDTFLVTVLDTITPRITCVDNKNIKLSEGDTVYVVSGNEFDPSVYHKCKVTDITNDFNNSSTLDGAVFPIGTTTVIWSITDTSGYVATCSFDVTVEGATSTNIQDGVNTDLDIYPNPVTDILIVNTHVGYAKKISIVDITGKTLIERESSGDKVLLDLSMLQNGIYFIKVAMKEKTIILKFIKN